MARHKRAVPIVEDHRESGVEAPSPNVSLSRGPSSILTQPHHRRGRTNQPSLRHLLLEGGTTAGHQHPVAETDQHPRQLVNLFIWKSPVLVDVYKCYTGDFLEFYRRVSCWTQHVQASCCLLWPQWWWWRGRSPRTRSLLQSAPQSTARLGK